MDYRLILFGLTGMLLSVACAQSRQYYFVNTSLTWTNAQSICRRDYADLATIENPADVDAFLRTTSNYAGKAWIGLYDDRINSWKWSLNDTSFYGPGEYTFRNWDIGQPDDRSGQQHCTRILGSSDNPIGRWDDSQCTFVSRFVCYNGTVGGSPSYVLSSISLNWTDAQIFCRANYVDLASIRNQTENEMIRSLIGASSAWIGLYREKLWSDGSPSLFRHWADGQPNDLTGDQCVAGSFNDSGRWLDESCSLSLPFICYKPIPPNAEGFSSSAQTETSITLQWNKISGNISFVLQFNGTETNISAPDGDGPVTHTVSSLTAGTNYTFTLLSVLDGVRSSGVSITAATAPKNAGGFTSLRQDETSITLQWEQVNDNVSFILQYNEMQLNVAAQAGGGSLALTVTNLTAGTRYLFTLFSVFENVRSSGVSIAAVTAPENAEGFRASEQTETSITLQWNKVSRNTSFVLQFNGTETNIRAPDGDGPVNHTVTSLSAGTKYTFMLFSVFENIRSSGVQLTAVTDPKNAEAVRTSEQTETSITLQWNKVNSNVSFVLRFNGTETNISTPDGDGPVNYTISSLTAGTKYTFMLFSVFENIRSSGVQLTAVTAPENAGGFISLRQDETSITLQWDQVNDNVSFILQYNEMQLNAGPPAGSGPHSLTVPNLTAGTRYLFTLFSVFENVRSSGVSIAAVTAPENAEGFRASEQNETSITLQWNKVNNSISFVLQFNGTETHISAPDGDGPVNHTVSSLTAGTKYTFILYHVFMNVRSSTVNITVATAPQNAKDFRAIEQDETSITLRWNKVNNNVSFILQFNGTETFFSAPDGDGTVTHTVSSLTAGAIYTFRLFSVFENIRSSGEQLIAVTAPQTAEGFKPSAQNDTSITLQWNKVNNNISFVLQFDGIERPISAPVGDGLVRYTITSLTAGTKYTFTLFSAYENVRSSGISIVTVTAPSDAKGFRPSAQNETSITLKWNKVSSNTSFVLQFNGTETNISAPTGDGPVTHTVSSLTARTNYTFTLFSVFENIRSSGVTIPAATGPNYVLAITMRVERPSTTSEFEMEDALVELLRKYNLPPQASLKVVSSKP